MLIQVRAQTVRLIRQHDHALVSGRLAFEWREHNGESLPYEVVLGATLHDYAWRDADAVPRRDPSTNGIHAFETHPEDERVVFYRQGIDEVEMIHRHAALLGSLHYAKFWETRGPSAFVDGERARQTRLRDELGLNEDQTLERRRKLVRLFDNLSLFVCLTGPEVTEPPDWVTAEAMGRLPNDEHLSMTWQREDLLTVHPFPFARPVELKIPYRELPRRPWPSDEVLHEAWHATPEQIQAVTVAPSQA